MCIEMVLFCVILTVTDLIELIYELLNQLEKVSEASLLVPDNFGKFAISLDEMIPDVSAEKLQFTVPVNLFWWIFSFAQGIIETNNLDTIRRMIKLKHFG